MDAPSTDLAQEIREHADGDKVQTTLATNQRIIARVTDGIYREPWAAFRELVANAYDADARHVVIETGAPEFDQITVRDDGSGMSPETLAYILKNIGASSKRRTVGAELHTVRKGAVELSPEGRPLIGKIGIGLFAVAQLTQHFQIITKSRHENSRISATVRLQTHNDSQHDPDDGDYMAGEVTISSESVPVQDQETHGTAVILYSLRPEVQRTLKSMRRWEAVLFGEPGTESYQEPPTYHIGCPSTLGDKGKNHQKSKLPWDLSDSSGDKFEKLVNAAADVRGRTTKVFDLDHFDEYIKLIWKLSLSLPLDYPNGHPFDCKGNDKLVVLTVSDQERQAVSIQLDGNESVRDRLGLHSGMQTDSLNFAVTFDGIALCRPLRHPKALAKPSRVGFPVLLAAKQEDPFAPEDHERAGGPLTFEAYLYWNSQIKPKDTAGVLVRIREASGTLFDRTFLNYQISEQTRLRQITAEIYVKEGLDGAINIDRESFNYSHPHFLYVQRWLHRSLRLLVNRLKAIAKEDLDRERKEHRIEAKATLLRLADAVWRRRLGDDADPPFDASTQTDLPPEVGDVEIEWPQGDHFDHTELGALSIVLEAYRVLSKLPSLDRTQLLTDILTVVGSKK